jgi:nucleoside-diphosphate-sugar epimerase
VNPLIGTGFEANARGPAEVDGQRVLITGAINRMDAVNHEGAVRLVEAAARVGVRRFVHLSSVGVYGAAKHSGVVDELHPHAPRNPYEISKDSGERAVRQRCAELGMGCVVLQPSNVLGAARGQNYPLLGLARMIARGWFRYFGSGNACLNYIAVEDVANAITAATLDVAATGVFIVNAPVQLATLVQWIAEELGVSVSTRRIPEWVGAVAASAGKFGPRWLARRLPLSPERLLELTNTTQFDGMAITRSLDFNYSFGVEAALRAMLRQYRREGLL